MPTTCLVTARDYAQYFKGKAPTYPPAPPIWNGQERRAAVSDRRANAHDRRWEKATGRRMRLRDRRRRIA
jgi:hypothetical protein